MMSCVFDCLDSYVMPTEAATTDGLSCNRALKLACLTLHHTLLAQGRNFTGATSQFCFCNSVSSLIGKHNSTVTVRLKEHVTFCQSKHALNKVSPSWLVCVCLWA
ncbi:hypothetical protein PAMP_018714 [Pampus punctatissimus]